MINGSPNKNGCTYTALTEVAGILREEGIDSEILHIGTGGIKGCTGCGACSKNGNRCVYESSIVNVALEKMEESDALIVGSPVYFASPNGSLISLLDRIFMAGNKFAYKPAASVASARRGGTTTTLEVIDKYFLMARMPVVPGNYYNIVHGHTAEEVKQDLEGMQTMRMLGRNMAWILKSIEAGKEAGLPLPVQEAKIKTSYIR